MKITAELLELWERPQLRDEGIGQLMELCEARQRDAGDSPFTCPVNELRRVLGMSHLHPSLVWWMFRVLEEEGVIECVDRGAPNMKGKKGKSTMWRYKFPMD